MAYYKDLDPDVYNYFFRFLNLRTNRFLAVGWLDPHYEEHSKGKVPEKAQIAIGRLRNYSWQPVEFMGYYGCQLCTASKELIISKANLFVPYKGKIFIAPEMILHYIQEHCYKPPDVFLRAVIHSTRFGKIYYYASLLVNGCLPIMTIIGTLKIGKRIVAFLGKWKSE